MPSISAELRATGSSTKPAPSACTGGPPSTAVKATAPPGGCKQRSANMAAIASAPASGAVHRPVPTSLTQATPTSAETMLPPITAQGWDMGPAGTQNSSTAEAPIDATSHMPALPSNTTLSQAVSPSAASAQAAARSCSVGAAVLAGGIRCLKKEMTAGGMKQS